MRKLKKYPPETEVGWYVVKEFISPLLCSYKSSNAPTPFNTNEVLNHHFSGTGVFNPYRYGKSKYHLHLFQIENHYYRSDYNAKHFTGYHRSDKIAQKSILNQVLGINTKKKEFEGYYVILCKIDIDGHQGEKDVSEVAQWLYSTYFKNSYWEPSTSFTGKHGYFKIAIPSGTSLESVHTTLNRLFELLDCKRRVLGFHAPIDIPCGLPPIVTWNNQITTPINLPKISPKEYKEFRFCRNKIKELITSHNKNQPDVINPQISSHFTYHDILKIINTPVPATIKSTQCGKLPRFNHTVLDRPSLDDIIYFYHLDYYNFSHLVELLVTLENDVEILSYYSLSSSVATDSLIIHNKQSDSSVDSSFSNIASFSSAEKDTTDLNDSSADTIISGEKNNTSSFNNHNMTSLYYSSLYYPCNNCLGILGFEANNEVFKNKKREEKENNEDIISNNANERTGQYITRYLRDYFKLNNTIPTIKAIEDDVCAGYRKYYGTGEETNYNRNRIISLLEKCIASFNPAIAVEKPKYETMMFIPFIKQVFIKAEYQSILKDTGARKCRPNTIILDLFGGYLLTHLSRNKDLTLSTYDGFQKFCQSYGVKIDSNKCLACRLLFEHYGWLEKIDANYELPSFNQIDGKVVKKMGKAMAYTLTPLFPYYEAFEKAVGKKNINKVRNKGMAGLQDWDDMGNSA